MVKTILAKKPSRPGTGATSPKRTHFGVMPILVPISGMESISITKVAAPSAGGRGAMKRARTPTVLGTRRNARRDVDRNQALVCRRLARTS